MPELLLEPAMPNLAHETPGWVEYVTNRGNIHYYNQQFMPEHETAWHLDSEKRIRVLGNNGANRNTSQLTQSHLNIADRMGMTNGAYIRDHNINHHTSTRSGAQAVHVIGKHTRELRHEREQARKAAHQHKTLWGFNPEKYNNFASRYKNEKALYSNEFLLS